MLVQLSYIDLIKAIQDKIEEKTKLKCYDFVEDDAQSPFYYVEVVSTRPVRSKTMYKSAYTVFIHTIAEENESSVPIYRYVQLLEEALSEDIELEDPFQLLLQVNNGLQTIKTDETGEKHAVHSFVFTVCHGFKCKV